MNEVWKDIIGYEGLYQISNFGRVKSFRKSNKHFNQAEHLLIPTIIATGYESVTLYRSKDDKHKYLVHRLVATAFISNPMNLQAVNHKDENKRNNHADNLEWCTHSYNNAYGTARIRGMLTRGVPIQQLTLEGFPLAIYNSASIASRITGIPSSGIYDCCNGKADQSGGYLWKYA